VDEVLPLMAEGKILPYLDIPFQHAAPKVLKAMRRPANQEKTLDRIRKWRAICPDLGLRSTFIVGFPGETEEDFTFLLDWLREARLTRVGCFQYENVEGAGSHSLEGQVPEEVKRERYERLMQVQQEISADILEARIGRTLDVLIDEVDGDGAVGRSVWDAPEIDGLVYLEGETGLAPGDIVPVTIERASEYDLWGTKAKNTAGRPSTAQPAALSCAE
jgi:ribosomal protein S12 methylthiotransferase